MEFEARVPGDRRLTVAWERRITFERCSATSGASPNIFRGGDAYPDNNIRKRKKPIRIFLVDGRNDKRGLSADGIYDQRRTGFIRTFEWSRFSSRRVMR